MGQQRTKGKAKRTEFKYVKEITYEKGVKYCASVLKHYSVHETIRAAAIMVDTVLVKAGREPVNILKRA